MVAILVVTEDHFQTREVFDCDARQQFRGGSTVIQICCGDNNDKQQTQCIHQQMTLAALDFLCSVVASLIRFDSDKEWYSEPLAGSLYVGVRRALRPEALAQPKPTVHPSNL